MPVNMSRPRCYLSILWSLLGWSGVSASKPFPRITTERFYVFYLVVGVVVALAAVEMAQIILTGGSSIMEGISKYLIYSNSYVLNFIKFGGKRTTALYFEPAFSLWH